MSVSVREVDHGWKAFRDLFRMLKREGGIHVKIGVLDNGKGADVHGNLTTAELAGVQEYGTSDGRIPARPFVGGTFEKYRAKYLTDLTKLVRGIYDGKLTPEGALGILGAMIASDMKKEVTTGSNFKPNADRTIKIKKSSRPLIDTGRMVNALSWVVVRSSGKGGG